MELAKVCTESLLRSEHTSHRQKVVGTRIDGRFELTGLLSHTVCWQLRPDWDASLNPITAPGTPMRPLHAFKPPPELYFNS